jgi:cell division protein FtsW
VQPFLRETELRLVGNYQYSQGSQVFPSSLVSRQMLTAGPFFMFAWRGLRTPLCARDPFGRYLALGVTTMVVVQAFFNISVVLALLPTKGIPLPFISYGGSGLFVMLASVGVLLNVSQQTE